MIDNQTKSFDAAQNAKPDEQPNWPALWFNGLSNVFDRAAGLMQ